eukprot:COSAG06_NODE_45_length_29559_cov_23.840835_5_plen_107_part_00
MFGKSAANPIDGLPGQAWDSLGTALRKKYKRHGVPRTAGSGEVPDAMGSAHPLMAPCAHDPALLHAASHRVMLHHAASFASVRGVVSLSVWVGLLLSADSPRQTKR